jgi:hypothetical protein
MLAAGHPGKLTFVYSLSCPRGRGRRFNPYSAAHAVFCPACMKLTSQMPSSTSLMPQAVVTRMSRSCKGYWSSGSPSWAVARRYRARARAVEIWLKENFEKERQAAKGVAGEESSDKGGSMNVWEMTLDEFLARSKLVVVDSAEPSLEMFLAMLEPPGWYEGEEAPLDGQPGFATAPLKRQGEDKSLAFQMLLRCQDDAWVPVGIYIDDTVLVVGPRKQGLGAELVLRCVPYRRTPSQRKLTKAGLATLTKAYFLGVGRAIAEGKEVRDDIQAAYENWLATRQPAPQAE